MLKTIKECIRPGASTGGGKLTELGSSLAQREDSSLMGGGEFYHLIRMSVYRTGVRWKSAGVTGDHSVLLQCLADNVACLQ